MRAEGEPAGRPRDLCTLVHTQTAHGKSSRRSDPQPRWHPA